LLKNTLALIKETDFEFENATIRIIANRNSPKIELAGFKIGPFEEGAEYTIRFWVARELVNAGIAHFREEESLDEVKLYKIQWKERVQSGKRFSTLPEDFYFKLRRYLADVKREAAIRTEKMREYEKTSGLSRDIINCRIKKIVSLSSSPAQTSQILKNLTREERMIYNHLYNVISEWRSKILEEVDEP